MPLNPILRQMFQAIPRLTPDVTPQRFREEFNSAALLTAKAANEPVHSVEDVAIPGRGGPIRARVYRPGAGDRLPAVVYYHGGGFVVESIETHDHVCRRIARLSGAVVVSVDYRLAPEHKFPAAVEDAYDAAKWVADNRQRLGVGDGIAVAGDSAGGNLAAAVALMARDRGEDFVKYQVLVYPVVVQTAMPTPSRLEYSAPEYPILTAQLMAWFAAQYFSRPEDALSPYASPLLAEPQGLPPALVITAEYDPLRDEGEMYAAHLRQHGVEAVATRYIGVAHGFINLYPVLEEGKMAISQIAAAIAQKLAGK